MKKYLILSLGLIMLTGCATEVGVGVYPPVAIEPVPPIVFYGPYYGDYWHGYYWHPFYHYYYRPFPPSYHHPYPNPHPHR